MTLSLKGNSSVQHLNSLINQDFFQNHNKVLDLSLVSFTTPVVSVVAQILKDQAWTLIKPIATESKQYLDWILNGGYQDAFRYIKPKIVSQKEYIYKTNEAFDKIFRNWLSEETASDLRYSFIELMDNVFDHANSQIGLCVAAQKYPRGDRIESAIADLGVGIAYSFQEVTDSTALNFFKRGLALKGTSKPDRHTGEGLSSVLEWLKKNNCEAMILSRNHVWKYLNSEETIQELDHTAWPGTLIWFSIPKDMEFTLTEVWNDLNLGLDQSDIDDLFTPP